MTRRAGQPPIRTLSVGVMCIVIASHSACSDEDKKRPEGSGGAAGAGGHAGSFQPGKGGADSGGAAGATELDGGDGGTEQGGASGQATAGQPGGGAEAAGGTGGAAFGGGSDTGGAGLGGAGGAEAALHPIAYAADRTHSPITPFIAAHLAEIAAVDGALAGDVFAKVGDDVFESTNFVGCFGGVDVDLDGRTELQATLTGFLAGDAAGATPYARDSLAVGVAWGTGTLLSMDPTPIELELTAVQPRLALVMIGLNDVANLALPSFGANLLDITDTLVGAGVVPIFFAVPPRTDEVSAQEEVIFYNGVVRAVAQAHQLPFVDYHREMSLLASSGLAADGIHPNVYVNSGAKPCIFSSAGLQYGYNTLNLLTLQALDRARLALSGDLLLDDPGDPLTGAGTTNDPIEVPSLPFSDRRDTTSSPSDAIDSYVCGVQDESGPEYVYHVNVSQPTTVRATVIDRGTTDVDLHLLDGSPSPDDCSARNDSTIETTLSAGDHYFVVDTYVSAGTPHVGEFLFVLTESP